ncbi:TetR family transcriptional regulator [Devosia sp.]|uniref:TetR/AcrR family transcriptional regulator n=1 Tax=Devosia sp. TaxID=1871048 RepID=UPI003A8F9F47
MIPASFQRARKPEQRELRRETILAAAADLFDSEGPRGTSLSAIAARAGFTKSNIYRYFESREEVLISLLHEEIDRFLVTLEDLLRAVPEGDAAAVARSTTDAYLQHPRFAHLLSILFATLEQNVSVEILVALKRHLAAMADRLGALIHDCLPTISPTDCAWAGMTIHTYVAGMWPSAHPSEAARQVLQMPEFAALAPSMERDLERVILALLSSLPGAR